jgi:cation:H+ antiporter
MGFLDLAVGNVLGSNMFNLLIIFAADVAMRGGRLLELATPLHWISIGLIAVLTFMAVLLLRSRHRAATSAIAAAMLVIYLAVMALTV